jgi:hypothetical protein
MATLGGSSDVSCGYSLMPGPRSSTHVSTKSSSVETSPLEGYEDAPIYQFTGIPELRKWVGSQSNALVAGRITEQYLVFRGVTKDDLAQIDHRRASIGKHTRMTHYTDTDLLIIKLLSAEHEAAHATLAEDINRKLEGMGLPKRSLFPFGARRSFGPNSTKEGDSTYQPKCRPGKDDWPTLVFDAGFSESLRALRRDARWWLTNSGGEVKIVIVISIRSAKTLRIEQWCMSPPTGPRPVTRALSNTNTNANAIILVPTKIQELTVIQDPPIPPLPGTIPTYTVTGAPLDLDFEKLLLRAPVLPEGNVTLTAADLQAWAKEFGFMIG